MSYKIVYEVEEDYLIARVSGNREKNAEAQYALEALKQISEECKKLQISKVISVWYIKGAMNPHQALILISNLKKYSWSKEFTTASVHPIKENFESHQYTAKVANTLNWNIRFFQELEDAKMWIKSTPSSETVEVA